MDQSWLNEIFENQGYSEEFSSGIMEDLSTRRSNNMTGLGDFHLRSAIKKVNVEKIEGKGGRFREKNDLKNFKLMFKPEEIVSGIPVDLLIYFLLMNESCTRGNNFKEFLNKKQYDHMSCCDAVKTRILMEINRDLKKKLIDESVSNEMNLRNRMLVEYSKLVPTEYYYLRSITEMLIFASSAISSKRDLHPDLSKVGTIIEGEDGMPILFSCTLGNILMVIGGDLTFISVVEAPVEKSIMEESPMMRRRSKQVYGSDTLIKGNHIMEKFDEEKWYCFSNDTLRMINDKLSERDIVIRNSMIMNVIIPSVYPNPGIIRSLFLSGDILLSELSNLGYKAIKCYEAIMTGVLLNRCDAIILDKREFLSNTRNDLLEEHPEFSETVDYWIALAECCESDHHISQLYGLYRLWGHPHVDSGEGMKKVQKIGTTEKLIVPELAIKAGRSFLEEVYTRYKMKWGRYPVFCLKGTEEELRVVKEESYLIRCLVDNEKFETKKNNYNPEHWKYVVSQKTFDIPDTFNLTMVVDDKAISPPKDYLIKVAQGSEKFMNPFERRGVLKWMNEDYLECLPFLTDINDNGLPDNDCVIGLYPKEREMNSIPRMFSLMSAKMRNYIVVTEHMIADDLLPFFPQITMMDDLLSLTKKIYGATRKQSFKRSKESVREFSTRVYETSVCLNMDFEKWNLNMRKESTYHVFKEMGRLYGLENLFNETYDIFERSYVHVSDENFCLNIETNEHGIPKLKTDGVSSYTDHKGGFEGLRQKGWTIFTVSVIRMILAEFPVSYKLMGQGDNQVLILTMKTDEVDEEGNPSDVGIQELKQRLKSIIDSLESNFLGLGLPLKTLESWRSEEFFLYGKFPVKKGVPLSMSLKRLSRSFPFSNEDSMTVDNIIGSIFTNAQAAGMSDIIHLPSYYSGLFETYYGANLVLSWHPLMGKDFVQMMIEEKSWFTFENVISGDYSRSRKISFSNNNIMTLEDFCESLCLLPKSLGGSNGITEHEFLMRGFPDNQTRDLTYLIELLEGNVKSENPRVRTMCEVIVNFIRMNVSNSKNLDFLVEDPCAINIVQPQTPLTMLRTKIKSVLAENISFKNKRFMELFKLSTDEKKRELLNDLAAGDVLFPRLLHDCYAASLFGFVDGIVSKVDKTVTVQRMCLEISNVDLIKGMCKVEENYMKYLHWRCSNFRTNNYEGEPKLNCPTNYIRWIREYGWGKKVEGVTVPYPSHTLKYNGHMDALTCDSENCMTCHISDYTPNNTLELVNKLGRSPPYLGSYTKEKIKSYDRVALYSSEPLLRRIIRLIRVLSWGNLEDSNLSRYLEDLLQSVSDVDSAIFKLNKEDIGGSLEHRYKDSALKHGALSSFMYGLGTWIHMSTDSFTKYSKGKENVTLHYQGMLCWKQARMYEMLLDRCNWEDFQMKEFHFHLDCEDCIKSVEYDIPDISPIKTELIPSLKDNPYCFTKNVTLTEKDRSIFATKDFLSFDKGIRIGDLPYHTIEYLFHEYWAYQIFNDIASSENMGDESVSVGILEISKYPRISFLRIKVELLLRILTDLLMLWCFKIESSKDKFEETALDLMHIKVVLENMIARSSLSGFVGLSVLFSWPEKIEEALELTAMTMPESCVLSLNEGLISAKRLLRSYLRVTDEFFIKSENIINLSDSVPLVQSLLLRYFCSYNICTRESCVSCRRNVLENMTTQNIMQLTGEEMCKDGHRWMNKDYIAKTYKVSCISEDILSKRMVSSYIVNHKKSKSSKEKQELTNQVQIMRKLVGKTGLFSETDLRFSSSGDITEGFMIYSKSVDYKRVLYRCTPSDLSAGYRIIDILAQLNVPAHKGKYQVLSIGDGTGGSGIIINALTDSFVHTATLLDCTNAFPQTFKHSKPTMQYMGEDSVSFSNQLSKLIINDIFSDRTVMTYDDYVKKNGIEIGFCDIELGHEEHTDKNKVHKRFGYSKLIEQLSKISVPLWICKARIENNFEMYHLVDMADRVSDNFSIHITPFCSSLKGEIFILFCNEKLKRYDGINRMLDSKTREKLNRIMRAHCSGRRFENLKDEYYLAANRIMMTDKVRQMSVGALQDWMTDFRLNFDLEMKSFTSFFYSIAAARNPREFVHHTDNKMNYEYRSDVHRIGERIFSTGISFIKSDIVCASAYANLEKFFLVRPAKYEVYNGHKVIKKYTYCVLSEKRLNLYKARREGAMKNISYTLLPPVRLQPGEIGKYFPIMRLINLKNDQMQDIDELQEISFEYVPVNKRGCKKGDKDTVILFISKSCKISQISMT